MPRSDRRGFLKSSLAGAAVVVAGTKSSGRVLGANDAVRLAVCGLNGRGGDHIKEFARMPGVRVTHLVDPDTRVFAKRQKQLRDLKQPEARVEQDVRRVLDDPNVDAITIAAPNHWHTLMTVWACQAGKDVYVEKPESHNVREGRVLVDVVNKTGRVVQHGTQRRAQKLYLRLAEIVRRGVYGKLEIARGIVYKLRLSIGHKDPSPIPPELDFDLWTGPAPLGPFHTNLVHYNWHWFWNFGNGDIANQGVHQMDIARWMIPGATLPRSVLSLGGRFGYQDQGETPNTQLSLFDFGDARLIFEVRGLPTAKYPGDDDGSVLHFEQGHVTGGKFYPKGKSRPEPLAPVDIPEAKRPEAFNIFANWIACVRSRQHADLAAPVFEGHYSAALCHLANLSYRLGSEQPFRPAAELPDADARETWEKTEEHLAKAGGVNLKEGKLRFGKKLVIDAAGEKVVRDDAANALLTRAYRAPFTLPNS